MSEPRAAVHWRGVVSFTALSVGLAWLAVLPLWLDERGLTHPLATVLMVGMMLTPTLATLLTVFFVAPEGDKRGLLGLRFGTGWPAMWAFAWVVPPALVLGAILMASVLGLYPLDLAELSGFRELLVSSGAEAVLDEVPIHLLFVAQLGNLALAPVLNAPATFGEELGWRGYLLPKLMPLGAWPALLISGAIWGLWHAPVILLGYNYPAHPVLGVLLMTGMCMVLGVLFGWTRLRTGSVWPAVFAHGALNGSAGLVMVMGAAGGSWDSALVGITGVTGWVLPLLLIALLAVTGRLPGAVATLASPGTEAPKQP